jgi:hypothetical protein
MRAGEIAIETAETGKVTAVVVVMSIFFLISASCRALILGTSSLLANGQKVPISWRKIPAD